MHPWCNGSMTVSNTVRESSSLSGCANKKDMEIHKIDTPCDRCYHSFCNRNFESCPYGLHGPSERDEKIPNILFNEESHRDYGTK